MSASDKKKLRKEEKMAKLTQRQEAEQKEAKKLKVNSIVFLTALALVFCIGIGLIAYNWYASTGLAEKYTTAVQIGDHKLTSAELNYYYADALNTLSQDWYSMYLLQLNDGFKANVPLDEQQYKDEVGKTWADYFIDDAVKQAAGVLAMCDEAKKNGYTMTAAEQADVDETILALQTEAYLNNFSDFDKYLEAVYGKGSSEETYRAYLENRMLAQSYYNHYSESLNYTAEQLAEKEAEIPGAYSSYSYTYFSIDPHDFITHENEDEHDHSDEDLAAAQEQARKIAEELVASGATTKEELDAAIAALEMYKTEAPAEEATEEVTEEATEEATKEATEETAEQTTEEATEQTTEEATEEATEETTEDEIIAEDPVDADPEDGEEEVSSVPTSTAKTDVAYDSVPESIAKWLTEEGREAGKIGLVVDYGTDDEGEPTEDIDGYYVVILDEVNKHETKLVTVRHILVKYTGGSTDSETGETVYTESDKQAARDAIAVIQAEFESGELTEERFAELAKAKSDDNADEGGLYEDVYPGWAVETFDAWCFQSDRKAGDIGVVETEYGVHLIYFVAHQEMTYREYMITTDLRSADTDAWYTGLQDSYYATASLKNTSLLNTSIALNSSITIN